MGVTWETVPKADPRARELADRHYSRQTVGAACFTPPGRSLVLLGDSGRVLWAVVANVDPRGGRQWRVTLFRNEGELLSSDLVRSATDETYAYWRQTWTLPDVPLRTEVDPAKVRRKRDPGRCFLRAGWRVVGMSRSHRHRGGIVLEAPAS